MLRLGQNERTRETMTTTYKEQTKEKGSWLCRVYSTTNDEAGKRVTLNRFFDGGVPDIQKAIISAIRKHPRARLFLGCEITVDCPLYTNHYVLSPDTQELLACTDDFGKVWEVKEKDRETF